MNARLLRADGLAPTDRTRMFELLSRLFEGVTPQRFAIDLQEKSWVLLLESDDGKLGGFSTLLFYRAVCDGEPANVVYSGDTIVDPGSWSDSILAPAWITAVRSLDRARPARRLLWLLITSGYRTYRFLPVFCREFYPCHDRPTPTSFQRLIFELAHDRFGSHYDPVTGIVRFAEPQVLVPALRGIPEARLRDSHVAFFARANPGHTAGDELVSLADLRDENLTRLGRRMVRRGEGLWTFEVAA